MPRYTRSMVYGSEITIETQGFSDIHDITSRVADVIRASGATAGLVGVSSIGSTASITTIEFEPALVRDMQEALEALWPRTMRSHHSETWGDDNGFSHLRASFMDRRSPCRCPAAGRCWARGSRSW